MKIVVHHTLDDFELIRGVMAARQGPIGVRALVLTLVSAATTCLLMAGWVLVVSSWMLAVPDPKISVNWAGVLVCSSFAFAFLASCLRSRFTEHRFLGESGAADAEYELNAEGLVRTTRSSRSLFYWTPEFSLESDTQRYFLSFGADVLLVVPARAFTTYAEFEAFGVTANQLAHG
ncbi:hypothetical protein [Pelomonas sp. KK5]|uniref:hypothetical protein n=1 Tax=Pelomonas sp. KK5 TaxID=1855730 RepID=UPI00117CD907|nr:hypothetical protein [Pelomonas sp. KK5]